MKADEASYAQLENPERPRSICRLFLELAASNCCRPCDCVLLPVSPQQWTAGLWLGCGLAPSFQCKSDGFRSVRLFRRFARLWQYWLKVMSRSSCVCCSRCCTATAGHSGSVRLSPLRSDNLTHMLSSCMVVPVSLAWLQVRQGVAVPTAVCNGLTALRARHAPPECLTTRDSELHLKLNLLKSTSQSLSRNAQKAYVK